MSSLAVSNMMYNGAGTGGTIVFAENGTTNGVSDFTFDGLAFGYRFSGTQSNSAIDVQSITITTNVPEPSTFALAGAGLGIMLMMIRRRRS